MESIFKIENLVCGYPANPEVLRVQELEIPRGKLVMVLGVSGAGKSTLLETLGLMNTTIQEGEVIFNSPDKSTNYRYSQLWADNQDLLPDIRNNYFSFVFQETNLMPNFTAIENVVITQLLQNVPVKEAYQVAKKIMNQLHLNGLDENANILKISGGQRQRLAFARAIAPHFDVLFGDEPTGNLDEFITDELFSLLKSSIVTKKTTAIIVSHNINVSLKYGDLIIVLTKDAKTGVGMIDSSNIFSKSDNNQWFKQNGEEVKNPDQAILSLMKGGEK